MRRQALDRWVQRFIAAYEISGWRPLISRFRYQIFLRDARDPARSHVTSCGCAIGAYVAAFDDDIPAPSYSNWIVRFVRLTGLTREVANGIMHGFDVDPGDDPYDWTGISKDYRDGVIIGQHVRAAMAREEVH